MPGKWITEAQVEHYMKSRAEDKPQVVAALKAGISERSGREVERGRREDPGARARHWRTRKDPLGKVWDTEILPMLKQNPGLRGITILEYLQERYPSEYPDQVLRTLQRRVKNFRALNGPAKEVIFRQTQEAGQKGLSDFTKLKGVVITINGKEYKHMLYHFRLAYSRWSYMKVIEGGESYTALAKGITEALTRLGGSPKEHRTDSLSAAFKNLSKDEQTDITERYRLLCEHYNMQASRNNRGKGHENGSVESAHGHLKRRIEQALLLRGSNEFVNVEAYQQFIEEVVSKHNCRNAQLLKEEKSSLQPLPVSGGVDYTEVRAVVTTSSTIEVKRIIYTVPSRLIGETLAVHLYDDRLIGYVGSKEAVKVKRVYPKQGKQRGRLVNYRHVIDSLVKKPGAFASSQIRDDLLPNETYRDIWQHLTETVDKRRASKLMVGLLHLAAKKDCEEKLGEYVMELIDKGANLQLSSIQNKFDKQKQRIPNLTISQHKLANYDQMIPTNHGGATHV